MPRFRITHRSKNVTSTPRIIEADSMGAAMAEFTQNWGEGAMNPWTFAITIEQEGVQADVHDVSTTLIEIGRHIPFLKQSFDADPHKEPWS